MRGRRNGRGSAHEGIFVSILSIVGLLVALFGAATEAAAQEVGPPNMPDSVGPKQPITAYNGSYTYSIPIEVPAFRGIEPKLKLSYDSARGIRNAPSAGTWLGIGWKLDGVSAIERVSGSTQANISGGRGSPTYNETDGTLAADNFMLDGDELIACSRVPGSGSPSCAVPSGALTPYAGRVENYLRIRRDITPNTWHVTAK